MKHSFVVVGIFVASALLLFGIGLFMIGNSHEAFTRHVEFYTELFDVNGLSTGMRVRVEGFDAGQLDSIRIPGRPSDKFRLRLQVDDKLRNLIRDDSFVTVETDGVVGNKFLLIHDGTDQSHEAAPGATLPGKEPIEMSAVIAKATGVIDQASAVFGDVQGKLNVVLDSATKTLNNADGLVTDVRSGKGSIGVLLNDRQTAAQLKQTVANAEQASARLNQLSAQAGQLVTDVQSRQLPAKFDETLTTARHAAQQIDQASQQVNATLDTVLRPDAAGENAAENIRESFSNVNFAAANMADDTEALKHEFFFRGFFKKRGYYSLEELTPEQYRANPYFQRQSNHRSWLDAADTFTKDANGSEVLSVAGEQRINQIIGNVENSIVDEPIVVEGYSDHVSPENQISLSRARSLQVAQYLEKHFHLRSTDIGVMPLNATPPSKSGKVSWNGACIVFLAGKK
jgi:phospholipid/cholesterol/gamma-HCH transport system substrate-binding protein